MLRVTLQVWRASCQYTLRFDSMLEIGSSGLGSA